MAQLTHQQVIDRIKEIRTDKSTIQEEAVAYQALDKEEQEMVAYYKAHYKRFIEELQGEE